jgi:hypothetical protein
VADVRVRRSYLASLRLPQRSPFDRPGPVEAVSITVPGTPPVMRLRIFLDPVTAINARYHRRTLALLGVAGAVVVLASLTLIGVLVADALPRPSWPWGLLCCLMISPMTVAAVLEMYLRRHMSPRSGGTGGSSSRVSAGPTAPRPCR